MLLNDLVTNTSTWSSWLQTGWYSTSTVLADNVTSFVPAASSISTSGSNPPMTTLLTVHLTAGAANNPVTLRSETCLRDDYTSMVGISNGQYVLPNE